MDDVKTKPQLGVQDWRRPKPTSVSGLEGAPLHLYCYFATADKGTRSLWCGFQEFRTFRRCQIRMYSLYSSDVLVWFAA